MQQRSAWADCAATLTADRCLRTGINYTNEKLHQCFINEVFESEKRVYRDEGLDPGAINFTDNAKVLEMVTGCNPHETKPGSGVPQAEINKKMKISLFGILDDVCKQEKNTGVTYCERVMKQVSNLLKSS